MDCFLLGSFPCPPQGSQAVLVKAHRLGGPKKGQDGIKLGPGLPASRGVGPCDGLGEGRGGRPSPLASCPLFALLDFGVPRVGR